MFKCVKPWRPSCRTRSRDAKNASQNNETVLTLTGDATNEVCFFFPSAPFWPHEGPLVQSCFAGQFPGTDCFYTGLSPHVLEVGKV